MSKLKYIRVAEPTPLDSAVLLQVRTGAATGSQLVATVHTRLDATLASVRERLVEIAVKGAVSSSSRAARGLTEESAAVAGLSLDEVKAIVAHRLHAFDMASPFEFVHNGGCDAYSAAEEHSLRLHEALPMVPSFGAPSTSPSWAIVPRPGSVAVARRYRSDTRLTINIERAGGRTVKMAHALLVVYVRQGDAAPPRPGGAIVDRDGIVVPPQQEGHSERIIMERLLMSDVPFGKTITPRHLSLLVSRWNINTKDFLGRTILHECCAEGNLPAVRYLLSLAAEMPIVPDEADFGGRTCLHYAVLGGHLPVVAELLGKNASPDLRPTGRRLHFSEGATAAIATTEEELASVARALPFNPLRPDFAGRTPLHIALSLRHDAMTDLLCGAVSALPYVVLQTMHQCVYSLYYGQPAPPGKGFVGARLAELLVEKAPSASAADAKSAAGTKAFRVQWQGEQRYACLTDLFAALSPSLPQLAMEGSIEAMVALLSHPLFDKALAVQRGPTGESLLHLAAAKGHTDMVRFLVSEDFADLFPQNDYLPFGRPLSAVAGALADDCGRTPLHYACMHGYADTVLELLRHAAATTEEDDFGGVGMLGGGSAAKPAAARRGASRLNDDGEDDSDSDDENYGRALITAADASIIVADSNASGRGGDNGHGHAARRAHLPNLNANAVDACGCSALQWALRNGHADCARVLLEVYREAVGSAGALAVWAPDRHGVTPLHAAAAAGADDVVHTLCSDYGARPDGRVLVTTSYLTRSAPSDATVSRRCEASNASGNQLLSAAPADGSQSTHRSRVFVRTLGPSPLWLALREGRQTTAALLIDLGALASSPSQPCPIVGLDMAGGRRQLHATAAAFVATERERLRISGGLRRGGGAAQTALGAAANANANVSLSPSVSPDALTEEAQYWHVCGMLRLALEANWLGVAQTVLASMHQRGYSARLATDGRLLVAFAARRNDFALRWLIDRGVGKDSHGAEGLSGGLTVLAACCYARNVEAVRYLLEAIPNVCSPHARGAAIAVGSSGGAEDSGAEGSIVVSPLYLAIASSRHEAASAEIVDLLLRKGGRGGGGASYSSLTPALQASPLSLSESPTPRASLYSPLTQAALRGDYSIVQRLCGHEATAPREAAVALWWLLNTVPPTSDASMVRRTVAMVLEAAEGPLSAALRTAFAEPMSFRTAPPSSSGYAPTPTGVAQYGDIAVALFRRVRLVADNPFHPFDLLHLAAAKLWHFGGLVRAIVAALQELPADIRRAVTDTSVPLSTTRYSHVRPSAEEESQAPRARVMPTSGASFIAGMADGSLQPYHRVVNRDAFASLLRNAPTAAGGVAEWLPTLRAMAEDCGAFPQRIFDRSQRSSGDYALAAGHPPTLLYAMALGLLPLRHEAPLHGGTAARRKKGKGKDPKGLAVADTAKEVGSVKGQAERHSGGGRLATIAAACAEAVSLVSSTCGIDYATGAASTMGKKAPYVDRLKSRLFRTGGGFNNAYFTAKKEKRGAPALNHDDSYHHDGDGDAAASTAALQEAATLAALLTLIRRGDATALRSVLSAVAALCRIADFSPLPRANYGASGPPHRPAAAMAVRITNEWGCPLVLAALTAEATARHEQQQHHKAAKDASSSVSTNSANNAVSVSSSNSAVILSMLLDDFRFSIAAPAVATASAPAAHQLLPNAIGMGSDGAAIALLLRHGAPYAVPSALCRDASRELQRRVKGIECGAAVAFSSVFMAAAMGRMDVLRLIHARVCAEEGAGGSSVPQQRFAQLFTKPDSRFGYDAIDLSSRGVDVSGADGGALSAASAEVHYDALSAIIASTRAASSYAAEHTALEMAELLITQGAWPYANPYALRIAARRGHWAMCIVLLRAYGPSIVTADLRAREAEAAEEDRVALEKRGGGGYYATDEDGGEGKKGGVDVADLAAMAADDRIVFASPRKIKGLDKCSAIGAMMRGASRLHALSSKMGGGGNSTPHGQRAEGEGAVGGPSASAALSLALDLLALSDHFGFDTDGHEAPPARPTALHAATATDEDADREVDTIDERIERLKSSLQASIAMGERGKGLGARAAAASSPPSDAYGVALYRHNVRLAPSLATPSEHWEGLLLSHRPSLLKAALVGAGHRRTAAFLALLAFCTQPLSLVAPPSQALAVAASASRSGEGTALLMRQLVSLLFGLTKGASAKKEITAVGDTVAALEEGAAATVPIDGYGRLQFALRAVVRRNQPRLLRLLLEVAPIVIAKGRLTDAAAMAATSAESLHYLALQHEDGLCAAEVSAAVAANPHDLCVRLLCCGVGTWTSATVAVPFASAVLQSTRLWALGRVERPMRGHLVANAIDAMASAKGRPLGLALLDVSAMHGTSLGSSSAPSLLAALRPAFAALPGGIVVAAASPLLVAIVVGAEETVHRLLSGGALAAHCVSSRAYAARLDYAAAVSAHSAVMASSDEARRIAFLCDGERSGTHPFPAINAAAALCLKAAVRVQAASGDASSLGPSKKMGGAIGGGAPEAALAAFKQRALILRSLLLHGGLHADNVAVISVAIGHTVRVLGSLRVPAAVRAAVATARAELLDCFLRSAAAATGSLGGPSLSPVRLTDRRRHIGLYSICDLPNHRHMLHAMVGAAGTSSSSASPSASAAAHSSSSSSHHTAVEADLLRAVLRCSAPSDVETARDGRGRSVLCYLLLSPSGAAAKVADAVLRARPEARAALCHSGEGWTPLMVMCRVGRGEEALRSVFDISSSNSYAFSSSSSSSLLLDELRRVDKKGRSALWHACANGHVRTARCLLDAIKASGGLIAEFLTAENNSNSSGGGGGLNPLLAAAWNGHDDAVMRLLEIVPAKLVFRLSKSIGWDEGRAGATTLLHAAAKGGCSRVVQYLVDLSAKAPAEFAKLTAGFARGHASSSATAAAPLSSVSPIRQIAPFTAPDPAGDSPLAIAYYSGHVSILGKLISVLREMLVGAPSASSSPLYIGAANAANATAAALVAAVDGVSSAVLTNTDKALLTGTDFNPFTAAPFPLTPSGNTFACAAADPSDPLELARRREEARQFVDESQLAAQCREEASVAFRRPLPIGWFGATLRLDAMLLRGGVGGDGGSGLLLGKCAAQRKPIAAAASSASLLRWCVANGATAAVRVCSDLGLMDGFVAKVFAGGEGKRPGDEEGDADGSNLDIDAASRPAPIGVTSALHIAAKRLDLDTAQLLVSLSMSSVFSMDAYGQTPLDVCLRAGAKAAGGPDGDGDEDTIIIGGGIDVDNTSSSAASPTTGAAYSPAERCARFLLGRMFAHPTTMAKFALPDGTLYVHTLFQRIAATRMPRLIGVVEAHLLAMAGAGSSSPSASALFVLQMLQRQDSESLRHAFIMRRARAARGEAVEEGSGGRSNGGGGGLYGGYGYGGDDNESENGANNSGGGDDKDASSSSIFHSDNYNAFEVALLHGSPAMVLRIAETVRALAMAAAKGYTAAGRPSRGLYGSGAEYNADGDGDGGALHPLGSIALSASFLRDHLTSVSPSVRALLYDLFRVEGVASGCGMQRMGGVGGADGEENANDSSDEDDDAESNGGSSSTEDEYEDGSRSGGGRARRSSTAKAKAKARAATATGDDLAFGHAAFDDARLSFADVRLIGIGELRRQPSLRPHAEAIYSLEHERTVFAKDLLPMLMRRRAALEAAHHAATGGNGVAKKSKKKAAALPSATTTSNPLRIELEEGDEGALPPHVELALLQALTTSAIAGRYANVDTRHRFPFLSTIAVRLVATVAEATGLRVSSEGPARLIDSVTLRDGCIVGGASLVGSEAETAGAAKGWGSLFGDASPALLLASPASALSGAPTSAAALVAASSSRPTWRAASMHGSDVNEAIQLTIGAQLPALRKLLDARCQELSDFFQSEARAAPVWRDFTPLHSIGVRVEWSGYTTAAPSGLAPSALSANAPLEVQSAVSRLLGTFTQRCTAMAQHSVLAAEMEAAMAVLLGPSCLGGRLSAKQYTRDTAAGASHAANSGASASSLLAQLHAALVAAGYGSGDYEAPPSPAHPIARGICFSFFPTSDAIAASAAASSSGSSAQYAAARPLPTAAAAPTLTAPLTAATVTQRHREGAEIVVPFCALGIGRPYVRGNGTAGLEPVLADPLATYLSPLFGAIGRAGALHTAQQLKERHFLRPLRQLLLASKAAPHHSAVASEKQTEQKQQQELPQLVAEFMHYVRFKLELEDDASSLATARLSQVQSALSALATVMADVGLSGNNSGIGSVSATTDPRSIVPAAIARNLFSTVKAITVIYTSAPYRRGTLRRVPAGSSGAGKADTIGDGAKIVLIVTPDDGHLMGRVREQLLFDTLRMEMGRASAAMQSAVSDLRHHLSAYFPAADFAMPSLTTLVNGGPPLPLLSPTPAGADSAAIAAYNSAAERVLYVSELMRTPHSSLSAPTAPTSSQSSASAVLQPLLKGLAVGWDTALGAKLRGYIRRIELRAPPLCPSPAQMYSPSLQGAPTAIAYDAVLGVLTYECPALHYPPPKEARALSSLALGAEAIAGQVLVALSTAVDVSADVDLARPFAPFCLARAASRNLNNSNSATNVDGPHYAEPLKCPSGHQCLRHSSSAAAAEATSTEEEAATAPSPSALASQWTAVAGQRFAFAIEQRNILNMALAGGVAAFNAQQRALNKGALTASLDAAIASGALGHVNVSRHLHQIEAKVGAMGRAVTPQWAPPAALRVLLQRQGHSYGDSPPQLLSAGDGDSASGDARDRERWHAADFAVRSNKAEGTLEVSFTAPERSGSYEVAISLFGTPIAGGALMTLSVVPIPIVAALPARAAFPSAAIFFTGKDAACGGAGALKFLPTSASASLSSPASPSSPSGAPAAAAVNTIALGVPFVATIPIADAYGNACDYALARRNIAITLNAPLEETYAYVAAEAEEEGAPKPCISVKSTRRIGVTLEGAAEEQLRIVSAALVPSAAKRRDGVSTNCLALALTLIAGAESDQQPNHSSSNSTPNNGYRLERVRAVVQIGQRTTVDSIHYVELFRSLSVLGREEWEAAEAARRGLHGDLLFMRDNKRQVAKAIIAHRVRLLEAGDDAALRKQVQPDALQQQYEKMRRRVAERCSLYFRRSTRRAQLARRQTEAASLGVGRAVVPRRMLLRTLCGALTVDEAQLRQATFVAFQHAESRRARAKREGVY